MAKMKNSSALHPKNKTAGAIAMVVIVVLLAKVLGLGKQIIQAYVFGASLETDVLNLAQEFVVNIDYVISQMIITAFTSVYIHLIKKDDAESSKFIINVAKIFLLVSLLATLLVVSLAPFIAKILAPSYSKEASETLSNYLRIFSSLLILFVLLSIFGSILNSHGKFVQRELTTVFQNIVVILCVLCLYRFIGINALIVSMFAYVIVNVFYLAIMTKRQWSPSLQFAKDNPFRDPNIKIFAKMILPLLVGYGMIYVNQQVDKVLVSSMGDGVVTSVAYAAILSNLITTILASLCTVFYSKITGYVAENQRDLAAANTNKGIIYLLTAAIPISIITFVCAEDIVRIVFGYGRFDERAITTSSIALMGYAFLFVPYSVKNMYSKFLYANRTTKWPMINGSIGIGINIGLSIWLSRSLGVFGIAISTTIAEFASAVLDTISSKKFFKPLRLSFFLWCLPFWAIGSVAILAICYLGKTIGADWVVYLRFIFSVSLSLIAFAFLVSPMFFLIKRGNISV